MCICRHKTLHKHLQHWAHMLDLADAFQQLSDTFAEGVMQHRAGRMLRWWQQWRQQQQQKCEQEEASWNHMAAYKALRYAGGSTSHQLLELLKSTVSIDEKLRALCYQKHG